MDNKKIIIAVLNTMNTIEVKGIENMRNMVMCFDSLEAVSQNIGFAAGVDPEQQEVEAIG